MPEALPVVGTVVGGIIGSIIPGVGTALGASIGGTIGGIGASLLQSPATVGQQVQFRGGERDPHPLRRFACGRFRTGLAEVFRHVDGEFLRRSFLIASEPIDDFEEFWLYGDTHITPLTNTVERNAYDMTSAGAMVDGIHELPLGNYDDQQVEIWVGLGGQTQFPEEWITSIGADVPALSTASWKERAALHMNAKFGHPHDANRRWRGQFPPPELVIRGGLRYDPTQDGTLSALGGVGAHRRDDPDTWDFTRNAARSGLHILRAREGLGRANRQILIDDWMQAIEDCGDEASASTSLDPITNADFTHPLAVAKGVTISGFDPAQAVTFSISGAWNNHNGEPDRWAHNFWAAPDGDSNNAVLIGDGTRYADAATAEAAFPGNGMATVSGGSSYTLYIVDDPFLDNTGSLEIAATAPPIFAADGLVAVESRETDLLGGILSAMGGFLSPSGGVMGVRPGVWRAPTETLSKARVRGFRWKSRSEPAVDCVIATYIDEDRGWQQTETRKVLVECSGRRNVAAASYTLVLGDASQHVRMSAAGAAVTVPPQSGVAWSAHDRVVIEFVEGGSVVAGSGVTLEAEDGLAAAEGEFIRLLRTAADTWRVDITTMDRVHPLDLPLVSNGVQATRLAKIQARRFWYNRTVEGDWTGVEYKRRVGDTVSYARDDLPICDGDYMIEAESLKSETAPGGGMMILKHMRLREDAEDIYAFDPATEYDSLPVDVTGSKYTDLDSLLTLDCYQEDYLDTNGVAQARLVGEATISGSLSTVQVEFEWQFTGAATWTDLVTVDLDLSVSTTALAQLEPVHAGVSYTLRARVIHAELGTGAWVECSHTIVAPSVTGRLLEDGTIRRLEVSGIQRLLE